MRLWALGLLAALALAALAAVVGASGDLMPTAENDHLLDGVSGLGGPKKR